MSNYENLNDDGTCQGYKNSSSDPPSFEQMSSVAPVLGQRANNERGYQHMPPSYMRQHTHMHHGLILHGRNGHIEGNYSYFPTVHNNVAGNNYHIMTVQPQNHMQRMQIQPDKHHVYYQQLQLQSLQNSTNGVYGIETNVHFENNEKAGNGHTKQRSKAFHDQQNIQPEKSNQKDNHGYETNSLIANYTISIISLSTTPLSGTDILNIVKQRTKEVEISYLPCVDFLVMCQQELRHALTTVTQSNGRKMATSKFYQRFFQCLPQRFYDRFRSVMDPESMNDAYMGIQSLLSDVKKAEYSGKHENMKNAFLGGMRDGESWGLRKWMSKHGGALKICNDLELIWTAFRSMKDPDPAVIEIARLSRPLAQLSFDRLRKQIPKAYQERSTAHPYLPFFHRLESVLQGLSEFDPEDDDVICLDDLGDQQIESKPAHSISTSSYSQSRLKDIETSLQATQKTESHSNESRRTFDPDSDSDIEIIDSKVSKQRDSGNTLTKSHDTEQTPAANKSTSRGYNIADSDSNNDFRITGKAGSEGIEDLAGSIESIASSLELGQEIRPLSLAGSDDFWSSISNYICILRLFRNLILHKSSVHFIDISSLANGDKNEIVRYYDVIKRPLFFRDIVTAIKSDGRLTVRTLHKWNMFRGEFLIQAVDLVIVNALAFVGRNADLRRKEIESLRQQFWNEIRDMTRDKKHIPIQRRETSEFVLRKKK